GVTYGLSPIMKTTPAFMTVPNLFCQRAARGEALQVLEDRPMAFIHVEDAAAALLAAATRAVNSWWAVTPPPEPAPIGQVARAVQHLMQRRGGSARGLGVTASEATFQVQSRLAWAPCHTLESGLDAVLDFFLAAG